MAKEDFFRRIAQDIEKRKQKRTTAFAVPAIMGEQPQPEMPDWMQQPFMPSRLPETPQPIVSPIAETTMPSGVPQPIVAEAEKEVEQPLWAKALNIATTPGRFIHERLIKGITSSLTAPVWLKQHWDELTREQKAEMAQKGIHSFWEYALNPVDLSEDSFLKTAFALWSPESKARKEYETWQTAGVDLPEAKIGGISVLPSKVDIKGVLEFAIDLFVPSTLGIARSLQGMGGMGKIIGKAGEFLPESIAQKGLEKGLARVGGAAAKLAGRGARGILPDLTDIGVVEQVVKHPDVLRQIGETPAFQGIAKAIGGQNAVLDNPISIAKATHEVLLGDGYLKAIAAVAPLEALGKSSKLFDIDDLGLIKTGKLKGLSIDTVATYSGRYLEDLTPAQRTWVDAIREISGEVKVLLRRNGIDVNELGFDEGGEWIGRRVVAKVGANGEVLDTGYVGVGAPRLGSKVGFEKSRIYDTVEEAIANGYRYLSPEEALRLNVQGAYRRVANKQVSDYILERVPYRTAKAPEALVEQARVARRTYQNAVRFKAAVNRAIRGERLPTQTLDALERQFGELGLRQAIGDVGALRPLRKVADGLITEHKLGKFEIESKLARARERAQQLAFGEARVMEAPAFAGKILTGENAQANAEAIKKLFTPQFNETLGKLASVNDYARQFALAGDASIAGIQLLPMLFAQPKQYVKAMSGFFRGLIDTEFLPKYLSKHTDTLQNNPNLLISTSGQFGEELIKSGWFSRKPFKWMGEALEPFRRGFDAGMTVAGVELAEAYEYLATTPLRRAQMNAFVNEFRGLMSSKRIGIGATQRQLESLAILAPQYTRATTALVTDIFRGNLRGELARKAMGKVFVGTVALSYMISKALGESDSEALDHLDPTNTKFGTWVVAGQNVGIGGKMRSFLKLYGDIAREPDKTGEHAHQWLRGNLSPGAATSYDLISGRNYIGDKSRDGFLSLTKTVAGRNLVPIWLQATLYEGGDVKGRLVRGGLEFAGGRTYPMTLWQRRDKARDNMSQSLYGADWDSLDTARQRELSLLPEIKDVEDEIAVRERESISPETVVYRRFRDEIEASQDARDTRIWQIARTAEETGNYVKFKEIMKDVSSDYAVSLKHIYSNRDYKRILAAFEDNTSDLSKVQFLDLVYDRWAGILYGNETSEFGNMIDEWGEPVWANIEAFKEYIRNTYGEEAYQYCENDRPLAGRDLPPLYIELRKAQQTLKPYWGIKDEYSKKFPYLSERKLNKIVTREKERMRKYNQAISQAYDKFYKSSA